MLYTPGLGSTVLLTALSFTEYILLCHPLYSAQQSEVSTDKNSFSLGINGEDKTESYTFSHFFRMSGPLLEGFSFKNAHF